jgi:hypothetical protein
VDLPSREAEKAFSHTLVKLHGDVTKLSFSIKGSFELTRLRTKHHHTTPQTHTQNKIFFTTQSYLIFIYLNQITNQQS